MGKDFQYRVVTTEVLAIREKSIVIQIANKQGTNIIARSLLNGFDDLQIEKVKHSLPRRLTFRVFTWKAEELGLA